VEEKPVGLDEEEVPFRIVADALAVAITARHDEVDGCARPEVLDGIGPCVVGRDDFGGRKLRPERRGKRAAHRPAAGGDERGKGDYAH
jgi:hypothetical protein